MNKIYKDIYKEIKKANTIVIARHVGADPDSLASSIALRDIIINTFPSKRVYTVGFPASKFKYIGILDKFTEDLYINSLLIVTDTPDLKRVDGVVPSKFSRSIKIDHHPFVEKYCDIEWIDDKASSASQMIMELVFNTNFKLTKEAAEKLYLGVVSDTNRFLFQYTTPKTFDLVSRLIKQTNIDFTILYEPLYLRPLKEVRLQSYIMNNMTITPNGLAYMTITEEMMKEYDIDAATAGNMVNNFNYIEEVIAWALFSVDKANDTIRGSIRSRGPIVNESASHYNGGGHMYASGVRLKSEQEVKSLVNELDEVCKKFKNQ